MTSYYTRIAANNFRFARSRLIQAPENGIYEVIRIPRFAFVEVFLNKITASTVGTLKIGFQGNREPTVDDFFFTNTEAAGGVVEILKSADLKYFTQGSGSIILTTASAFDGDIEVLARYSVIH